MKRKKEIKSKRTTIWVDDAGQIHDGPQPASYPSKHPQTSLNAYGEIVEHSLQGQEEVLGVTRDGDRYYEKNGNKYLDLRGPQGDSFTFRVSSSVLGPIVNDYINYLIDKNVLHLPKKSDKEIVFLEGEMPTRVSVDKSYEYSGKCESFDLKKKLVVVDSRLSRSEKIATLYHELMHARGIASDREAHTATIEGLQAMMKTYPALMKHEEEWGKYFGSKNDPDQLEARGHYPGVLREATNYALASRGSFDVSLRDVKHRFRQVRSGLEKYVSVLFFASFIGFLGLSVNASFFTGKAISEGTLLMGSLLGVGTFFLFLFFLSLFVKRRLKNFF